MFYAVLVAGTALYLVVGCLVARSWAWAEEKRTDHEVEDTTLGLAVVGWPFLAMGLAVGWAIGFWVETLVAIGQIVRAWMTRRQK